MAIQLEKEPGTASAVPGLQWGRGPYSRGTLAGASSQPRRAIRFNWAVATIATEMTAIRRNLSMRIVSISGVTLTPASGESILRTLILQE